MMSNAKHEFPTNDSQRYRIRVRGVVDPSWSLRLCGLAIAVEHSPNQPSETVLTGELPDQAALHGVLSALYSLGNSLLSVESYP